MGKMRSIFVLCAVLSCGDIAGKNYLTPCMQTLFHDMGLFTYNLFTVNTISILGIASPFFVGARAFDEKAQRPFYCPIHHRNKHQPPRALYHCADIGSGFIMGGLSLCGFLSHEENLRETAQVYLCSLPMTYAIKRTLKTWKCDASVRPKNAHFSKHKTYYGGCPSGHMLQMAYATTLFGKRCGAKFGVPLGLYAGFVFLDFFAGNRHTLSQLIAGSALGVVCGFAADKTASSNLRDRIKCDMIMNQQGDPCVEFSYHF